MTQSGPPAFIWYRFHGCGLYSLGVYKRTKAKSVTDGRTDGQTDKLKTISLCGDDRKVTTGRHLDDGKVTTACRSDNRKVMTSHFSDLSSKLYNRHNEYNIYMNIMTVPWIYI